jgi:hypothetical protein
MCCTQVARRGPEITNGEWSGSKIQECTCNVGSESAADFAVAAYSKMQAGFSGRQTSGSSLGAQRRPARAARCTAYGRGSSGSKIGFPLDTTFEFGGQTLEGHELEELLAPFLTDERKQVRMHACAQASMHAWGQAWVEGLPTLCTVRLSPRHPQTPPAPTPSPSAHEQHMQRQHPS